jgi:glutathione S-transferase
MEPAQLFYVDGSPFARLCRTLIIDWNLPVETVKLDWPLDAAFFDENPLGQVPVLKTVGETIFPTSQIAEQLWAMTTDAQAPYFDPLFDRQILLIVLAMGDAMVAANQIVRSGLEPTGENTYGLNLVERHGMRVDRTLDWLESRCGTWMMNDSVSVCDYALACILLWSDSRCPIEWRNRPKLARIVDVLSTGDSFAQTVPSPWKPAN